MLPFVAPLLPVSTASSQIKAIYAEMGPDFVRCDWARVRELCTPDFTEKFKDGKVKTLDPILKDYDAAMKSMTDTKIKIKPTWIKVHGKTATSLVTYEILGTSADSAHHHLRIIGSETHTWRKMGGNWRQSHAVENSTTTFVDGKPTG